MSRVKEWMEELHEQAEDRHLAKLLGISYEDLIKTNWRIEHVSSIYDMDEYYLVEFLEGSPSEILDNIDRLDGSRVVLHPWEFKAEYDYINDQFDAITESRHSLTFLFIELDKLKELSLLQGEGDNLKAILNRQVFISIIGSMETFLSDTFMRLVFKDESSFRSFVQNHKDLSVKKFPMKEIFDTYSKLKENVKMIILDTSFHNIIGANNLYKETLGINFPKYDHMLGYIYTRHDLVHRNGKTKDGVEVLIKDNHIDKLIEDVKVFLKALDDEINKLENVEF